jgi:oligoendopeptidase F
MTVTTLLTRDRLDPSERWAIEHVFESSEAFDAAMEEAEGRVRSLVGYRGRLAEGAGTLLAFLAELSDAIALLGRLKLFALLPAAADTTDPDARRLAGRFMASAVRWGADTAFMDPELLAIDPERLRAFRAEEAGLERFAAYLARLERQRPHVRAADVEDLLTQAEEPFGRTDRVRDALLNELVFAPVEDEGVICDVAPSTIDGLIRKPDRDVRRRAFSSYADGLLTVRRTLGELYLTRVAQHAVVARTRAHESPEAAALSASGLPTSVLDATVAAFTRRIGVWHRYWEVRRRLLGVERLEAWDLVAPLGRTTPTVRVGDAARWIVASARPMGEAYAERLRAGLERERWVDLRPHRGKREGAFCAAAPGAHPLVLMSYVDDLASASMLAHELGHAMHAELMHAAQDPLDGMDAVSVAVAETASNAQQALLRAHLLAGPAADDPALEAALLEETMLSLHRYAFVMPTLVRFEQAVHGATWRGEPLEPEDLVPLLQGLLQEGYGDAVTADERSGIAWAQFPHLGVPFYTFQYTVGLAVATAVAARIASGDTTAAHALHQFMAAGAAMPPLELFGVLGVDITSSEALEGAFDVIEGYVVRLEAHADR